MNSFLSLMVTSIKPNQRIKYRIISVDELLITFLKKRPFSSQIKHYPLFKLDRRPIIIKKKYCFHTRNFFEQAIYRDEILLYAALLKKNRCIDRGKTFLAGENRASLYPSEGIDVTGHSSPRNIDFTNRFEDRLVDRGGRNSRS